MKMKMTRIVLLLGALILLAVFAYREYAAQELRAQLLTGTVEATRVEVSTKESGYIEELFLQEGMTVRAGDAAARIGRRDLDAAVLRDEAALAPAATSPPVYPRASTSRGRSPARASSQAAVSPAIPPPTTRASQCSTGSPASERSDGSGRVRPISVRKRTDLDELPGRSAAPSGGVVIVLCSPVDGTGRRMRPGTIAGNNCRRPGDAVRLLQRL